MVKSNTVLNSSVINGPNINNDYTLKACHSPWFINFQTINSINLFLLTNKRGTYTPVLLHQYHQLQTRLQHYFQSEKHLLKSAETILAIPMSDEHSIDDHLLWKTIYMLR